MTIMEILLFGYIGKVSHIFRVLTDTIYVLNIMRAYGSLLEDCFLIYHRMNYVHYSPLSRDL